MTRIICPHCGGSIDACLTSGAIRRISGDAGATVALSLAEYSARKAAKMTSDPEVVKAIMESAKALESAYMALSGSLEVKP